MAVGDGSDFSVSSGNSRMLTFVSQPVVFARTAMLMSIALLAKTTKRTTEVGTMDRCDGAAQPGAFEARRNTCQAWGLE